MNSPDLEQIKKELLQLIWQQIATLENHGFASASIAELQEFDARRDRIYQLGEKLSRAAKEAAESTDQYEKTA